MNITKLVEYFMNQKYVYEPHMFKGKYVGFNKVDISRDNSNIKVFRSKGSSDAIAVVDMNKFVMLSARKQEKFFKNFEEIKLEGKMMK